MQTRPADRPHAPTAVAADFHPEGLVLPAVVRAVLRFAGETSVPRFTYARWETAVAGAGAGAAPPVVLVIPLRVGESDLLRRRWGDVVCGEWQLDAPTAHERLPRVVARATHAIDPERCSLPVLRAWTRAAEHGNPAWFSPWNRFEP